MTHGTAPTDAEADRSRMTEQTLSPSRTGLDLGPLRTGFGGQILTAERR